MIAYSTAARGQYDYIISILMLRWPLRPRGTTDKDLLCSIASENAVYVRLSRNPRHTETT